MRRQKTMTASTKLPPLEPLPPVSSDPATARRERAAQIIAERRQTGGISRMHWDAIQGDRITMTLKYDGQPGDGALLFARAATHARRMSFVIESETGTDTTSILLLRSGWQGERAIEQAEDLKSSCESIGLTADYSIKPAQEPDYPELAAIMASVRDDDHDHYEPESN